MFRVALSVACCCVVSTSFAEDRLSYLEDAKFVVIIPKKLANVVSIGGMSGENMADFVELQLRKHRIPVGREVPVGGQVGGERITLPECLFLWVDIYDSPRVPIPVGGTGEEVVEIVPLHLQIVVMRNVSIGGKSKFLVCWRSRTRTAFEVKNMPEFRKIFRGWMETQAEQFAVAFLAANPPEKKE